MPDIGLLQGPPRKPSLTIVPASPLPAEPVTEPVPEARAAPVAPALIPLAEEAEAIKVAAHAAVVSDAPIATLVAELPAPDVDSAREPEPEFERELEAAAEPQTEHGPEFQAETQIRTPIQ